MIATGSFSAIRGSTTMTADSENSTTMILIVDAGSMKRGNFTDAILTVGGNSTEDAILIAGVGSGRIGAAILTAGVVPAKYGRFMIVGTEENAVKVAVGSVDADKCKVG
jgi:hypothetical protein